ncbi:hypothetical protein NQ318_015358 [Aromia moschata]|uniref:Disease resistance R13L4/SHOC-2-like LRR domain-containing protein n=1 Tax=Aromia moschata TaxID=1265417 RepID=A0AAV8YNV5_9CUCU|nr:hypothetical protein NQ318_015358 [Aromia moschata]
MMSDSKRMRYVSEEDPSTSEEESHEDKNCGPTSKNELRKMRSQTPGKKQKCFNKNALLARENRLKKENSNISSLRKENKSLSKIVDNHVIANSSDISLLIRNIHQSTGMSVSTSLDKNLSLKNVYVPKPILPISKKTAHPWEEDEGYPSYPTPDSNCFSSPDHGLNDDLAGDLLSDIPFEFPMDIPHDLLSNFPFDDEKRYCLCFFGTAVMEAEGLQIIPSDLNSLEKSVAKQLNVSGVKFVGLSIQSAQVVSRFFEFDGLEFARAMESAPVSCLPSNTKMSKAKKVLEEAREIQNPELDLADKGVLTFEEMPGLSVPPGLANLTNLEILNLANNQIEELPLSLSSMPKLRILNLSINRLYNLPRGFGAFPLLEVLDLTYNNLKEDSLPGNFFMMETLRALYLGDNDFEYLPPDIKNLKNLQILVLRENDLIELPKEIGELTRLRELHVQGNRLTILPPEIGNLDMASNKSVFKFEGNEWVPPIADQLQLGVSHLMDYLRTETYRILYNRYLTNKPPIPPPCMDKAKKISRIR